MILYTKIIAFLAGLPMTVTAGAFLLLNLAANIQVEANGVAAIVKVLPFNTVWLSIAIPIIPIIRHAVHRLLRHHGLGKISASLFVFFAIAAETAKGNLLTAGTIGFVTAICTLLEDALINMSKNGVKTLLSLVPNRARKIKEGIATLIPISEIKEGDSLRVLQGEIIPADGTIINGKTSIDQSAITGGFLSVTKDVGDKVYCGTTNKSNSVDISVTKTGEEDSLHKLIKIVKEADIESPVYRTADRYSFIILPVAIILSCIAGIVDDGSISTATATYSTLILISILAGTFYTVIAAVKQVTQHGVVLKYEQAIDDIKNDGTTGLYEDNVIEYGNLSMSRLSPFGITTGQLRLIALSAAAEVKRASREIQACTAENNTQPAE